MSQARELLWVGCCMSSPRLVISLLVVVASLTFSIQADAQSSIRQRDALYPGSGRISVTAATGVPFVAIAEVAVGVTDHVTLGVLAGQTPALYGVGLRPRVALWRSQSQRITWIAPTLYYPRHSGRFRQAWVLSRPTLLLEERAHESVTLHLGVGLMIASVVASDTEPAMQGTLQNLDHGLWASVQFGGRLRLSSAWSAFLDVDLVHDLDGPSWSKIAALPVVASLGVSWLP